MDKQDIFGIEWNAKIPNSNTSPATKKEIAAAMVTVNKLAKDIRPGEVISFDLRSEVADAVRLGINSAGSGAAVTNLSGEKYFDKEKGMFISMLYVAKDHTILNNYISEM